MNGSAPPVPRVTFAHLSQSLSRKASDLGPILPSGYRLGQHTGAGVTVCVIDSGVDTQWSRGRPRGVEQYAIVDGRSEPEHEDAWDVVGHGTACASIIDSLAPDAALLSLRVVAPGRPPTGDNLIRALSWAVDRGAHVVSMSLSTSRLSWRGGLSDVCDRASRAGVALVCAAHNRPVESYPWRFASVISVGSHAHPAPERIESNPIAGVDFYARGVDVPVAWKGGGSRRISGNSFATPHIAGHVAQLREAFPRATVPELKTALATLSANLEEVSHVPSGE